MNSPLTAQMLDRLKSVVAHGGPEPHEYPLVSEAFLHLYTEGVEPQQVAAVYARTLRLECLHGHAYLKPHGYAGDFLLIDRIYTHWLSPHRELARHDEYFQSSAASMAVRNRKSLIKHLLVDLAERTDGRPARVLNMGSGPARDVFEFFSEWPNAPVFVHCVDADSRAIEYAAALCAPFADRMAFEQGNALRLRLHKAYDLIWSAGLFDYLSNYWFKTLATRYIRFIEPHGELVIGNFSPNNPTRAGMELLCQWYLKYRDAEKLRQLATAAGAADTAIRVEQEPQGVNLFLRICNEAHCCP